MLSRSHILIAALLTVFSTTDLLAKSAAGGFWRSLLVPGWGQYYTGMSSSRFLWAEVVLWGGRWGLMKRADFRSSRFRTFAMQHSGADLKNKSRDFFDDIGFYESRSLHDQYALYQDGPLAKIYGLNSAYDWHWDSEIHRNTYRNLRNESRHSRRQALYVVGGLVANRIVSAIHAARSYGRQTENLNEFSVALVNSRLGAMELAVVKRF